MKLWLLLALAHLVAGCGDVRILEDVPYDERFGSSTTMDVYLPPDRAAPRPAVMLIHGGGWESLSKDNFDQHGVRLAEAGYVAASINYRLIPDGSYPALMQDSICALAFLRAHAADYGIDPDRVAVYGYSAGGHLASLLGVGTGVDDFQPDCSWGGTGPADAVVSGAGVHDLRPIADASVVRELIGGSIDQYAERFDRASPITHVHADAPPYLLVHGTADAIVDVEQSEWMRAALRDAGARVRLITVAGGGHLLNSAVDPGHTGIGRSSDAPEAWAAVIDFLDRELGAP